MVLFVVLLDCWQAKASGEADVPRRSRIVLVQASLDQMEAEVLGNGLPGLGVI